MMLRKITVLVLVLFLPLLTRAQQALRVAAASDLNFALDSLIKAYASSSNDKVIVTYGSSGKFYEQITNGAPFDIFFSADIAYPDALANKGLTSGPPEIYGVGRLVVWTRKDRHTVTNLEGLVDAKVIKVAIANPRHAPYGKRAEEALKHHQVYEEVSSKLVFGENISQTAQFVFSGSADAGIIALSLALSPAMSQTGRYSLIPVSSHTPLDQAFVVLKKNADSKAVKDFVLFLRSTKAREIFSHFGFSPSQRTLK